MMGECWQKQRQLITSVSAFNRIWHINAEAEGWLGGKGTLCLHMALVYTFSFLQARMTH